MYMIVKLNKWNARKVDSIKEIEEDISEFLDSGIAVVIVAEIEDAEEVGIRDIEVS